MRTTSYIRWVVPVAEIRSTGSEPHHANTGKQCGQIMYTSYIAVGAKVILTKNQKGLTSYGLNNGALGKVISILYEENVKPPKFPFASGRISWLLWTTLDSTLP